MKANDDMVVEIARDMLDSKITIREAAVKYKMSKSGIHNMVTRRLELINVGLAIKMIDQLRDNQAIGRIKGGIISRANNRKGNNNDKSE